jgi:hypothetical protein
MLTSDGQIRESDQIRRDYEARMHSKILATKAQERERAANAIVKAAEDQQDQQRELQNGLQQAVARNYRIRQSHETEMNQMLVVMDEDRKHAAAQIRHLEQDFELAQEQVNESRTENAELRNVVAKMRGDAQALKAAADNAKKEADAARKQAAEQTAQIKKQMTSEMQASIEREVKRRVAEAEDSISKQMRQEFTLQQNSEHKKYVAQLQQEADSRLQQVVRTTEEKANRLADACERQVEVTVAEYSASLQKCEAEAAQLKKVNTELSTQLRMLSNTEDERAQAWKNQEASLMFELAAARKRTEYVELQRDETEKKLETVVKESDTMRRVFEAALTEADSVAAMLKEQLEIVRGSSKEQALASEQEIQKQMAALDKIKAAKSAIEASKFESESELREELQSMQMTAEQLQLGKEHLAGELQEKTDEGTRSKTALTASIREADILTKELEAADRRCDSIQREAEVQRAVLETAKVKAVEEYKAMASMEKAMANEAAEARALAEKKLKQAELALSRSKYELGTALQQNQKMRLEQEEAEVVLDLLDGTLSEVRDSHAELVYEANDIVATSKGDLSSSLMKTLAN